MYKEGDYTVRNRLLTIGVCFLFLLVIFSTGCDDKKEGDNTSENSTKEEDETWKYKYRGIKVQHMEGYVNQTEGSITDIRLYLALQAGTDAVDIMDELVITLTWTKGAWSGADDGTADLVEANNSEADLHNANVFWAESIVDPHDSFLDSGYLDQDSIVVIYIFTRELQQPPANADFGDDNGLVASSSGTIKFTVGCTTDTIMSFNVPTSFPDEGGWVEFY